MTTVRIHTAEAVKPMKPMHGGGQPPVTSRAEDTFFHYMTEAGIPYSRLHDVGGAFGNGKYVDIPNIFRDFDADEADPASYDFTFTDLLLAQLHKAGVEPYYRLGVTIENAAAVKSYWIDPPRDFAKWARIAEHIIRHYTEGWADGFFYKITYWEIWGEPDNTELWTGTKEDYYAFYDTVARHLKSCFGDKIRVGCYGSCGFYGILHRPEERTARGQYWIDFFEEFITFCKTHGTPLDFFSWHSYADTESVVKMDTWLHERLVSHGLGDLETHLNEWDPYAEEFGTGHHAAELAAMMISMQKGHPALCCIYDMRTVNAPYCPLFNPITHKPVHGYYAMVAFNTLYKLGTQVKTECDNPRLYAVGASDGEHHALMLANLTGEKQTLTLEGADLSRARYYVLDEERLLSWAPNAKEIDKNTVLLIEW